MTRQPRPLTPPCNLHAPAADTHTLKVPRPLGFPMGVSLKQEKPLRLNGFLSSLAPGKKIALRNFSENAPLSMPIRTVELYNQPFLPDDYVAIKNMTAFKQFSIIQPNLKELG